MQRDLGTGSMAIEESVAVTKRVSGVCTSLSSTPSCPSEEPRSLGNLSLAENLGAKTHSQKCFMPPLNSNTRLFCNPNVRSGYETEIPLIYTDLQHGDRQEGSSKEGEAGEGGRWHGQC